MTSGVAVSHETRAHRAFWYAWLRPRGFAPPPIDAILDTPWWRRGSESNRRTRLCRPLHLQTNQ